MNWIPFVEAKRNRYQESHGELDERGLVRRGNVAYAAGLGSLMAGERDEADEWFRRAALAWRESFDESAPDVAWGRAVGALKAFLLACDEDGVRSSAGWALELDAASAESPIGRYAAVLALLALGRRDEAHTVAASLAADGAFPSDVAASLVAIAASERHAAAASIASVVRSFETRREYLEDAAVADTALALAELARRNELDVELEPSPVLP
jgi:hypothetical protein